MTEFSDTSLTFTSTFLSIPSHPYITEMRKILCRWTSKHTRPIVAVYLICGGGREVDVEHTRSGWADSMSGTLHHSAAVAPGYWLLIYVMCDNQASTSVSGEFVARAEATVEGAVFHSISFTQSNGN